ncbi:MAG: UMP kinase [Nanoarchaeota archaeon]
MNAVVSLSGKFVYDNSVQVEYLKTFRTIILNFVKKGNRAIIVVGGGGINRIYNKAAQEFGRISNEDLDLIGIAATKLNATLVRTLFGEAAFSEIVENPNLPPETDRRIIIASGYKPGSSSDLDAVILAKHYHVDRVINLTNEDFVYDKDPDTHKDAKPLPELTFDKMQSIVGTKWRPRLNMPFGPIAVKRAKENGLQLCILNGNHLKEFEAALAGEAFRGSVVK